MTNVLRYGAASRVEFDLPTESLVAECDAPRGQALDDPAAAVAAALIDPLDFPPLAQTTVPGDSVAIALGEAVPQAAAIVAGIVQTLLACGVEPEHIAVVRSPSMRDGSVPDPRDQLPDDISGQVALVEHDPDDQEELSYLATSSANRAVYINRTLHDAELILPVGCFRLESAVGFRGIHAGLFPTFSDRKTLERFRAPSGLESPVGQKERRKEVDEVGWLLGIAMTIQVIPGVGDRVLHVLAGEVESVFAHGERLCREAWSYSVPRRASLVVASIEGDPAEQTWENVARALSAASRCVEEDGAIAVCTELETKPGNALLRLAEFGDPHRALSEIRRQRSSDAWPAAELAHALERGPVYLLSRLDDDLVEELGMAPAASAEEIGRLAQRHPSCLLLGNAQYAVPTVEEK